MTPEQFCYWLQGALELGTADSLDAGQVDMIREHLALVFDKRTPECTELKMDMRPPVILDAQRSVDELVRKGLMQRGVPTRAPRPGETPTSKPDIMPIPTTIAPTVPRWPDETTHDPLAPKMAGPMGLYDPNSAPQCVTGQVIDLTKAVSFC